MTRLERARDLSARLAGIYHQLENRAGFNKQSLSTLLICLAFDDEVDAAKRMDVLATSFPVFLESDEGRVAGNMIEAYENRDAEAFTACKKTSTVLYLDNEIAKMAQGIVVRGERKVVDAAGNQETVQDEEDGGFL